MFYTKIAKIISALLFFIGISRVLMGVFVLTSENPKLQAAKYLGRHTSGEAIDKGLFYIFIAVSLGVLVEISVTLHNASKKDSKTENSK